MNWTLALPEIVLALCGLAILVFGVVQKKEQPFLSCSMLTIGAFVLTGFLVVMSPDGVGYNHIFVNDDFARFMKILSLAGGAFATMLTVGYARNMKVERFEFPVLLLFSTLGAMMMASSENLMTLFIGLELSSLAIYILCAFARDEVRGGEAGLKYFVLGSLASGLLLYGSSLVYGYAGTMEYGGIQMALSTSSTAVPMGLMFGIVFMLAGLTFKLSAVPFHMWTPDVYQGAPTSVTAYMAGAPKFAAFALLLRVMAGPFGHVAPQWQILVEGVSMLSMLFGSLAAIPQTDIKRLMAYSSIGHMGYALMGLCAGTAEGMRGTLVYLTTYLLMNVGAFAVIIAMRRKGREVTGIADLAGLGKTDPGLATAMAIFMFSMAGAPPLAGFFGKMMVFYAAINAHLFGLAAIGVVSSVIGGYYYVRIVKVMFFDDAAAPLDRRPLSLSFVSVGMGIATTGFLLVLGPVSSAAQAAAQALFR
ncbi:proton-translocating NADH-quinone oxidoreductase, chain N [Gluconacetobacter diazotrophicus PA1 5]|uniref:NADH-quinone oxidoreductase subunit N n=2 Tax=Gluconacetobacter diazotrophicus TaxID=33996 RepID=NUON_GLUDA|nr:NADH-quinone oxidoreductase subunit NuoN [Gluconacetobacter diazotrophicus]A9HRS3.1 RecName: Full=NADH-quinone oxidoreductase subunit N; AltName: Full=NADH dehydrogenase I subunit N; AltName: Full=NDH-1 subunit N [Gluconacetobacter diazotrophicus PA1 5]ACI53067.1 proton-translocating NADH-quinone oxidoreductase, chain N [Gluconacetobacter diazotrophicus PA1 5]MBB2155909.1 NADH-quinone oxidoreductase subunit NuoN [Gluconacetobacter diazotrophicus]TWB07738.1 NADH dehydrogenase subunit N [Gluco